MLTLSSGNRQLLQSYGLTVLKTAVETKTVSERFHFFQQNHIHGPEVVLNL